MTSKSMNDDVILVYARIRPPAKRKVHRHGTGKYQIIENEDAEANSTNNSHLLHVTVPKEDRIGGYVDNTIEHYQFSYHKVFEMDTSQNDIFESMARPIIDNTLNGYNGTIFAYGQTGSGKTYTMTGGTASYDDRGLIPRCISYIFKECAAQNKEYNSKIEISYLEIYNGEGYDLLNEDEDESKRALSDLPKVRMFEDENGIISLSNMSLLNVSNEEEALNYLFIGDTNRMICETPNNDTSSRSHCIFTIFIERQKTGSDKVRRSKLNLVDLAGSERVYKSALHGNILNESKYINLSLHFLEQVIIALHSKQAHIPYRNSMITTILKDSLGGNCKTVMISTLSMDIKSLFESISTCKFSQRVALIKNVSTINETVDPSVLIPRLKLQIKELKHELLIAKGLNADEDSGINIKIALTDEEKERCKQMVHHYVDHNDDDDSEPQEDDVLLFSISDERKIKHCFKCMKRIIIYEPRHNKAADTSAGRKSKELKQLQQTVQERDHEINILVQMLKKHKVKIQRKINIQKRKFAEKPNPKQKPNSKPNDIATAGSLDEDEASQRNEAFKRFMHQSALYAIVEQNKDILRRKFDEAKHLGMLVNTTRNKMNEMKGKIEQVQIARAMDKMDGRKSDSDHEWDDEKEENGLRDEIEKEKEMYRAHYLELKNVKVEIDHMKSMLKKNRRQIQLDFELWWKQKKQQQEQQQQQQHTQSKVITGDQVADQNIAQFYKMRDEILESMK